MNNNNQQQQRTKRYRYVILSLPVLTVVISVVSTVAAFLVSTYKAEGKGIHFLPFISNIGDHRPESSVFTFGMTLSGCVTYSIIFIRYLQVRNFFVNRDLCNHASLVIGSLFIIGKFMVVSFQLSSQIVVHFFGASVYFIGAFLYCVLQTVISYNDSKYLYRLRLFLSIFMFISGFFFGLFLLPSLEKYYLHYRISEISEWFFAALKMVFMLTFVADFQNVIPIFSIRNAASTSNYETFTEDDYEIVYGEEFQGLESRM